MEPLYIFLPWIIALNIIWYYIKYLVGKNGYVTHVFMGHIYDIIHFRQMIKVEQDENRKRKYQIVLFAFYFVLILPLFILIAIFIAGPISK